MSFQTSFSRTFSSRIFLVSLTRLMLFQTGFSRTFPSRLFYRLIKTRLVSLMQLHTPPQIIPTTFFYVICDWLKWQDFTDLPIPHTQKRPHLSYCNPPRPASAHPTHITEKKDVVPVFWIWSHSNVPKQSSKSSQTRSEKKSDEGSCVFINVLMVFNQEASCK